MKRILLVAVAACIAFAGVAQDRAKAAYNPKKDVAVEKPYKKAVEGTDNLLEKRANPTTKSALPPAETVIGPTRYDLQTNQSVQNRIYMHADGTIGATWTFGLADAAFADRGTGYNYYDGSAWGAAPTARIEDARTGWPSYSPWGPNGEIVTSHQGNTSGVKISKRATKGSGSWEWVNKTGPTGNENLLWPRSVTSGTNNEYLHLIGLTAPVANGGTTYNGQDGSLLYSRSNDGGSTWQVDNVQLPGTDITNYRALGGDNYHFAKPVGNTLAFVYGEDWADMFLMKSTDNGTTWTKTVIFQHPYPFFDEAHDLVLDTPSVCDGSVSCSIDPTTGKAHVFFGCMRVLNDDTTDGNTSYFPYTDGIGYWNEDMPAYTSIDPDDLYAAGKLVGYTQDVNGNDTILEFVVDDSNPAKYYLSVSSMVSSTIDNEGKIFVIFTSIVEGLDNGTQNYRHVYYRRSEDHGATWSSFVDLTGSIVHNFDECVFPSVSPTSDATHIHLMFQMDEEPGLAVRGDEDPYGDNEMIYMKAEKSPIGISDPTYNVAYVSQNYPNPFNGTTQVDVNLTRSCELSLQVTNAIGQVVFETSSFNASAGHHLLTIDGSNLQCGLYFYTVKAGATSITKKMMVK